MAQTTAVPVSRARPTSNRATRERVRLVETCGRLVREQKGWAARDRAGDRRPLTLAARQIRHATACRTGEAHRRECLGRA